MSLPGRGGDCNDSGLHSSWQLLQRGHFLGVVLLLQLVPVSSSLGRVSKAVELQQ